MRFDLTDLRLFLAAVETGSITRGAEQSHLALASASARIAGMEEALGTALLERGRRGVAPTAAGRALAHHARMVLEQVERMRGDLGRYAKGLRGHVRLLANTAATSEFLPEALAGFLAQHREIDVDLEERLSWEIVEFVAEGRAEIGIVADTVDHGELETFPFRLDRLVAVVPPGHRLARRRGAAFSELVGEDFVGLSEGSALDEHLTSHAARLGRRPRYRVRLRSFDAVCRMVEHGVGIGVVPEAAAARCGRAMRIRSVPLTDAWALRRLTICVRRLAALPTPARLLVAALQAPDETSRGGKAAPQVKA